MNSARMKSLEEGLTGISRKIFEATPIAEAWTPHQISAEFIRRTGSHPDMKTLRGCLDSLCESGLVKESHGQLFQRVVIREKLATIKLVKDEPTILNKETNIKTGNEDDVLGFMSHIGHKMRAMADEIDEAALKVQERLSKKDKHSAALAQLKEMLRD